MTIKAVIFDMDGVLVDAKAWHYETLNQALKELNYDEILEDEHLTIFDGLSTKQKLNILHQKGKISKESFGKIFDLKQEYTFKAFQKRVKIEEEKIKMFEILSSKYDVCLCSNAIKQTVDIFLNSSGLRKYFKFILSNEDVQNPKPNSEIYDTVIKKLDLFPSECLIVEDNFNGITAAKASGANVLEVNNIDEVNLENIEIKINSLL